MVFPGEFWILISYKGTNKYSDKDLLLQAQVFQLRVMAHINQREAAAERVSLSTLWRLKQSRKSCLRLLTTQGLLQKLYREKRELTLGTPPKCRPITTFLKSSPGIML